MKVTSCLYCGTKDLSLVTHRVDNNGILQCGRCGVMMVENLSDDTESLYTADYFEKAEGTKNGYTNYLSSPSANLIGKYGFSRLFARKGGRHLDLGCADGSLIENFISEGFVSGGLEISKDAVAIARAKGLDVQFSRLHTFPANHPKSSVITAFDLLEHADKPGSVLQEVYKNLEKDGYFVFSTLSVRKKDPTDYWFNNSLEHYVYYDRDSLNFILSEVFGKDNYAFVEEEINGIAEFWGFAKKGKVTSERKLIELIEAGSFDKKDPATGYLMGLFYDQVAKVDVSDQITEHFSSEWTPAQTVQAKFYRNYFQGQLESALKDSKAKSYLVPATQSVYWQALAYAEQEFGQIRQRDIIGEYNEEVLRLRNQVFTLRDELHTLLNSRVVGKVIKAREAIGSSHTKLRPALKAAPRKGLYKTRKAVAKVLPPPLSRAIMRGLRGARRRWRERQMLEKPMQYPVVENQKWDNKLPLVSVVIPFYNRADTIDETLVSLAGQTFRNFEVIIVDDGSTETASVDKLKGVAKTVNANGKLPLQVIYQKNQGVAAARNTGIAAARGKYIVCLDSDDLLENTYIEKAVLVLETQPDVSLITTHQDMFGVVQELYRKSPYSPMHLYEDNMVITAAVFTREAWQLSGGYKAKIGYEDWEFWLSLAENGFWGKLIPEPLFKYRTSMQSRYVGDKDVHWNNIKTIRSLHPKYKAKVRALLAARDRIKPVVSKETALINTGGAGDFLHNDNGKPNVLITVPWMTFGGAETLIYNFCREIKDNFNMSFITGLKSEHEWEYKFREISPDIYHLPNLFEEEWLYLEFVSHYIESRKIDMLHIIHNGFTFAMLPELKKRHPHLKVIVTVFNDRAPFCEDSIGYEQYVDTYSADNQAVTNKYAKRLQPGKRIVRIPNGINAYEEFSPEIFDRAEERAKLGLQDDDIAVLFVGRLSEEKNPDVFMNVASKLIKGKDSKRTRFLMVGDGPMRPEIDGMFKSLNSKRATYLGYQAKPAPYMAAADVFVLPSSVEGFPLAILEAMAMQVAPVASRVGGVPDIIDSGHDGFVVEPGSAEEIAAAIIKLEQNPAMLEDMKARARQKIEAQYSNRILGTNYRKMYKETLA